MGVDLRKYKKEILDAAWVADVKYVCTSAYDLSGEDYEPVLTIGVDLKSKEEEIVRRFREHLDKTVPDFIGVVAAPTLRVADSTYLIVDGGRWTLIDSQISGENSQKEDTPEPALRVYLLLNMVHRPITPYSYFELIVQLREFYSDDVVRWNLSVGLDGQFAYEGYVKYCNSVNLLSYKLLERTADTYVHHHEKLSDLERCMIELSVKTVWEFCEYFKLGTDITRLYEMYASATQYIRECRKAFGI